MSNIVKMMVVAAIGTLTAVFILLTAVKYIYSEDASEVTPTCTAPKVYDPTLDDALIKGAASELRYGQVMHIQKGFYEKCEIEIEDTNGKDEVSGTIVCEILVNDIIHTSRLTDKTIKVSDLLGEYKFNGK